MPETTLQSLEERVAVLEKRLAQLLAPATAQPVRFKDWRLAVGMFSGHDSMQHEIDEAGRQYREADRRDTAQ